MRKGRRSGECALIGSTHQLVTSPKVRTLLRRTQGGGVVMPPKNSVVVRARDRARPSFSRSILAFGAAAPTAAAVSVWVDSTRAPAGRAYQKDRPSVKLNTVTHDGDAYGADTLQTKVGLYDRTGSGWPDVVFGSTDNETSWGGWGRVPGAAERGSHPPGDPEQLRHRLPEPRPRESQDLLPAQPSGRSLADSGTARPHPDSAHAGHGLAHAGSLVSELGCGASPLAASAAGSPRKPA